MINSKPRRIIPCIILLIGSLFPGISAAEITEPYTPANQLETEVLFSATQNPSTLAYKYNYSIMNSPKSQQEAWVYTVNFNQNSQIFNISSPKGWMGTKHFDQPKLTWNAYLIESLPEGYVDDGNLIPSPYNIKPGETLAGFSFESLSPPAEFAYSILGFVKLPSVTGDAEDFAEAGIIIPPLGSDGIKGVTSAPKAEPYYSGGRRPAVDGFLVFLNLKKGITFKTKAIVILKFAVASEVIYPDSFVATLNNEDITHHFKPDDKFGGDLYAELDLDTSSLIEGRNVLITSVEGLVPGTSRKAGDVDRVQFNFIP